MTKVSPPPAGSFVVIGVAEYSALWALANQAMKPVPSDGKQRKERLMVLNALGAGVRNSTAEGDSQARAYFDWLKSVTTEAGIEVEP